jgi:Phosphopantetheine attachment site
VAPHATAEIRTELAPMARAIDDVKNWMNMFRWIVKLIRDEYGVDEKTLVRTAALETEIGLNSEQVDEVLEIIRESFGIAFPEGTLDEVLKLEELCMLASWLKGLYKQPEFISAGYQVKCRAMNAQIV